MTNDKGGSFDALINYWITRLVAEKSGDARSVPAFNLEVGGAGEALWQYLDGRELEASIAFELGLELVGIVFRNPHAASAEVGAAIEAAIADTAKSRGAPK